MAELTVRPQATSMQLAKPSPSSKREIVLLLTKFAERRQAQVNGSTLATFAEDLSVFPLSDIEMALARIASVPRREGETAFPEIATIQMTIRDVARDRKAADRLREESETWAKRLAAINKERAEEGLAPWNTAPEKVQDAKAFIADLTKEVAIKKAVEAKKFTAPCTFNASAKLAERRRIAADTSLNAAVAQQMMHEIDHARYEHEDSGCTCWQDAVGVAK